VNVPAGEVVVIRAEASPAPGPRRPAQRPARCGELPGPSRFPPPRRLPPGPRDKSQTMNVASFGCYSIVSDHDHGMAGEVVALIATAVPLTIRAQAFLMREWRDLRGGEAGPGPWPGR
jgi:hypothetical protein